MTTKHTQPGSNSARTWVLALTSVAALMVALDALVVTTALSTIRLHLHASIEQLEWTVNAYGLSFAVLLMTGSALGDRFGRRRLFTAGLGLFTTASAACALAPDIGSLIAARTVQGAGAAMVMPLALAQLSAAFPPERRAWALGIFSSVTGLAVLGGPVVGGAITQGIAWQWIFWLNVPIGLLTIPLILRRIDESFGPKTRLDVGGVILETGAALGIVWGLVRGNSAGWGSVEVIAALALGVLFAAAFVAWEIRAREPMLPMRLFRSRDFSSGNAAIFFLTASLVGAVFFIAQFLQTAQGDGPLDAGLRLLPLTTTLFFIAPIAGALINRVGERPLIVGGLLLEAVGMAWIALIVAPHLPYVEMIAPLILTGAGVSMAIPATQSAVIKSVSPEHIGKASGTFSTMRQLGAAFGIAILVAVFAGTGSYASAQAFTNGFAPALGVSAVLSLSGTIAVLVLRTRNTKATQLARRQPRASLSTPKRPAAAPVPNHNQ
jgi:EmrB/QacA subfamily drug resistance transporter